MTDPLDDPFHAAALQAYLEVAHAAHGWPDSEAVKRRAYQLYGQELAAKDRRRAGRDEGVESAREMRQDQPNHPSKEATYG